MTFTLKIDNLLSINPEQFIKLKMEKYHVFYLNSENVDKIEADNNKIIITYNQNDDCIFISIPLKHFLQVIDYLIEKAKYWQSLKC
jgi:hypothetical protein